MLGPTRVTALKTADQDRTESDFKLIHEHMVYSCNAQFGRLGDSGPASNLKLDDTESLGAKRVA